MLRFFFLFRWNYFRSCIHHSRVTNTHSMYSVRILQRVPPSSVPSPEAVPGGSPTTPLVYTSPGSVILCTITVVSTVSVPPGGRRVPSLSSSLPLYPQGADVAPLDFTPSTRRSEVVEFGAPYGTDGVVILCQAPGLVIKPFLLLNIFSLLVGCHCFSPVLSLTF